MYRLWLWPLVIVGIGLASWAMVNYDLPGWLFSVALVLIGFATKVDLKLSGSDQREIDTVLKNVSGKGAFGLRRGSQVTLGVVSILFALMLFAWAYTAPGNKYFTNLPGLFCVLVASACLLPRKYRGYCGDIIAVLIVAIAVWFLVTTPWWEPGKKPVAFAWIYGGLSIGYLLKRYASQDDNT